MKMEELAKEFVLDCKERNLAPRTIDNYGKQVFFVRFLKEAQGVKELEELKPVHIKQFVVMLQEKKNKPKVSMSKGKPPFLLVILAEIQGKERLPFSCPRVRILSPHLFQ